jgi:hypothetical protein
MPKRSGRNVDCVDASSQPVDLVLAQRAEKHQGNVTRPQLEELLSNAAIAHRIKTGRLYREYRGVYSVGRRATSPLQRASAAVLACGPGAALSHASAMTLWGFWKRWEQPFEVVVPCDRRTPGITIHRSTTLHWCDLTNQLGIRVTTPARTILDISPRQNDKALKRTVNNALHTLWLTEDQLSETLARHPTRPGAARIARLLGLPGTPTRSGWEDDFPAFCATHGLPQPVMGALVLGYTVDALFEAEKVIVELDSREFHLNAISFETDRERDAETLAHGYVTIRITWERLHAASKREADRLRAILADRAQAPRAA